MARIRTIKPAHVEDRELPNISLQAHLVWVLSWCFSDDEGVIEADPLLIKNKLFPRRNDVRIEQVEQWIGQLVKARYIIPFTHEGISYYIQRTFKAHQKIDKPQGSKIPSDVIRRIFDECSTNGRAVEYSIVEDSKGKVKEGIGDKSPQTKFDFEKKLIEYGFEEKTVKQWLIVRKNKKATNSEIAFDSFIKKIEQRACEKNEILKIIVERSWSGFEWEWVDNLKQNKNGRTEQTERKPIEHKKDYSGGFR